MSSKTIVRVDAVTTQVAIVQTGPQGAAGADASSIEGTAILSTGEAGGTKFLREDGDGTSSWQTISGGGDALVANPLSQFAATTSAQLAGVISDETGSGALVFGTSPTLVTPALGTPASGVLTNCTGTAAGLTVGATTGVEAGADVTDTANVTAAGALMDSEVSSLTGIKTLTVPDSTTISTFGATLVDDLSAAAARTTLGVDAAGTDNSTDVTLGGTGTYISIAGQVITVDPITESDISDLGAYITGITGSPLSDLSDVTITSIATGEILKWNGTAWINNTLAEAGIAAASHAHEGTAILSTGEVGGTKFLREDGDGTCSWQSIAGGGDALVANPLSQFAATTSAQLAGVISDETGSGALVFGTSPTLVTPALGTPASGVLTNCTGTAAGLTVGATTGVEAGADVTDTANVTAAGALMDSEVSSLTGIKTLTVPDSTTISTFGATLVDDLSAAAARTTLGVDAAGTDNSTDVTLGGTGTYISIAGQVITVDPITESDISDLGAYITGITGSPLSDLSDVTITSIATGEILKWNGTAWINNTLAEAGIAAASHAHEGTAILSTGEVGGTKFLREDGDGTCSWQSIAGGGDALVANPLSQFAATTSAQLAGVISDETGSGALVFGTSPTLVTPVLGTPSSGNLSNCTALNATQLTSGTIPAARVGADHIDAITEIASGLKSGSDATLVTGTAGTSGNLASWDANGDAIDASIVASDVVVDTQTIYEEIWIDAGAMVARETNGATAATEEYATNDVMSDHYLFDSVTEEGVQFKLAMPDSWNRSTIKVKFLWDAATGASASDGVTWGVSAQSLSNDDAIDAAFSASVDTDDTVIAVGDLHITAASSAVTVSGTPALGDLILFEVTRVVGDANDDMAEDAKLLGVQVQFGRVISNSTQW